MTVSFRDQGLGVAKSYQFNIGTPVPVLAVGRYFPGYSIAGSHIQR